MPTEPKQYRLHKKVTPVALLSHGFIRRNGTFHYKRILYDRIYVEIEIDVREKWMTYFIKSQNGDSYYTPFYLPDERGKYDAYEEIVSLFHKCMDGLCAYNILWRPGYKKEASKKKINKRPSRNRFNDREPPLAVGTRRRR